MRHVNLRVGQGDGNTMSSSNSKRVRFAVGRYASGDDSRSDCVRNSSFKLQEDADLSSTSGRKARVLA
jgi:hypothetical protein